MDKLASSTHSVDRAVHDHFCELSVSVLICKLSIPDTASWRNKFLGENEDVLNEALPLMPQWLASSGEELAELASASVRFQN